MWEQYRLNPIRKRTVKPFTYIYIYIKFDSWERWFESWFFSETDNESWTIKSWQAVKLTSYYWFFLVEKRKSYYWFLYIDPLLICHCKVHNN